MDISTEIRKLTPTHVRELALALDYGDSWKRVMAIIPNTLFKDNYECDLLRDNLPKYHSEHFKLIENASDKLQRSCTEILFDEWGTSGRIRPTLGHLLHLLKKAELFKAADYVAVSILNQEPPERPKDGPAAKVNTTLPKININQMTYNYNENLIDKHKKSNTMEHNLINNQMQKKVISKMVVPKLVITECPEERKIFHQQVVAAKIESDMIKFSESEVSNMMEFSDVLSYDDTNMPDLSALLNEASVTGNNNMSTVEEMSSHGMSNNNVAESTSFELDEANIPELSALNISHAYTVKESISNGNGLSEIVDNIPNLSILNVSIADSASGPSLPNLSILQGDQSSLQSDYNQVSLPDILINSNSQEMTNSEQNNMMGTNLRINENSTTVQGSYTRQNCHSPLPNLSLNTLLPHFGYNQIEIATNNFDETPHLSALSMDCDESITTKSGNVGRFLGSGAFGSVYLAIGLCPTPVAVKKLHLHDVTVVNVDDTVTKQFKNEVEVLSKYKHSNLLTLIGYSCDGPTYCLLYEYISGGALKERLQENKELLSWKDRLNIAYGTANAVCYLHAAFETPLIHRDIKSANILLDCKKKPKLCDFGLIKLTPNTNTITGTSIFGTSAYMAPEAFRGDISVKLDTFSFGVVVLELLTGLPPVEESRHGCDIVTHVSDTCEDDLIEPLLDKTAGDWNENDIEFGQLLFEISLQCLEDKKKRPTMVEVSNEMVKLIQKCS